MTVEVGLTRVPGAYRARGHQWISGEIVAPSAGHQVEDAGAASLERVAADDVELRRQAGGSARRTG